MASPAANYPPGIARSQAKAGFPATGRPERKAGNTVEVARKPREGGNWRGSLPARMYMAVYNRAHELASALRESQEYREYRERRAHLDETARRMLRDYRMYQARAHAAHLAGQKVPSETTQQGERLRGLIGMHKPLLEFMALEDRLLTMIGDVQKILGEAVELWDYLSEDDEE